MGEINLRKDSRTKISVHKLALPMQLDRLNTLMTVR